ncbi:unnamed protein product, partial [marine sediment metagenome]
RFTNIFNLLIKNENKLLVLFISKVIVNIL